MAIMTTYVSALGEKQINYPTKYESYEDLEYIFVQSSTGVLYINGVTFEIKEGDGAFFREYDLHRFVPDSGETLIIDYFWVDSGTYMYAMSNPYQAASGTVFFQAVCSCVHFHTAEIQRIRQLFERLYRQKANERPASVLAVFYVIELIGLYNRELFK